jgi:hypothetical protein
MLRTHHRGSAKATHEEVIAMGRLDCALTA